MSGDLCQELAIMKNGNNMAELQLKISKSDKLYKKGQG